jgi:hypothetical protein
MLNYADTNNYVGDLKEPVCCTEALPAYKQPAPHMTFDDPEIIYYGPHACSNCGVTICKMAFEFGGNSFTYPDGPIYPNTIWHPHVCDPKRLEIMPKPKVAL